MALSSTTLKLSPNPATTTQQVKGTVKTSSLGFTPNGAVALFKKDKVVGKGSLTDGTAKITLTKQLKPGQRTIEAVYLGNSNVESSEAKDTVRITKGR